MTSEASNSAIDVASRALILIGADPITSFSETTTEATVASNLYEDVARACLTSTRWRFATNQAILNALTDAPTGRFDIAHQLPSDLLMLHALTVNDNLVDFTQYGDKVFSNRTAADSVVADYTFRANEVDWPSYFTLAVEYMLASVFAGSIARDPELSQQMLVVSDRFMAKARTLDSQISTSRKIATSRFITDRRS
tara:strand:+ start:1326 stop:1913 length:588 start_codon:yes stop_codon:yes gene_type:complete